MISFQGVEAWRLIAIPRLGKSSEKLVELLRGQAIVATTSKCGICSARDRPLHTWNSKCSAQSPWEMHWKCAECIDAAPVAVLSIQPSPWTDYSITRDVKSKKGGQLKYKNTFFLFCLHSKFKSDIIWLIQLTNHVLTEKSITSSDKIITLADESINIPDWIN